MQHNIFIFGQVIDLSDASKVAQEMQGALSSLYFPITVSVRDYKELDENSFELYLDRQYEDDTYSLVSQNYIYDYDESLIIDIDTLYYLEFYCKLMQDHQGYEDVVLRQKLKAYHPIWTLCEFLKCENKDRIGEKIKDVQIVPEETYLYIKVTFEPKLKKRP